MAAVIADLFSGGRLIEVIIGVVVAEGILLGVYYRLRGRGIAFAELWPFLLSGVFLLLALRAALVDGGWSSVAIWLSLAFAAHLADLWSRWRR